MNTTGLELSSSTGVLTLSEKSLQSRSESPFIATAAEFERKMFSLGAAP
jgi:hypothetical protein